MATCKYCGAAAPENKNVCLKCKEKAGSNKPSGSEEDSSLGKTFLQAFKDGLEDGMSGDVKPVFEESFGKKSIKIILGIINTVISIIGLIVLVAVLYFLSQLPIETGVKFIIVIAVMIVFGLISSIFEFAVSMIENMRRLVDNSYKIGLMLQKVEGKLPDVSAEFDEADSEASADDNDEEESYEVGSLVTFGNYPQKKKTPSHLEWKVLENDGKELLLVAKYGLDCSKYHSENADATWNNCDLRKWLNKHFISNAFSDEEKSRIVASVINTDENPEFGTGGCGETRDKVFCLSIDDIKKYFSSPADAKCSPTNFAVNNNAKRDADGCSFWLRSPGLSAGEAAVVDCNGAVNCAGCEVSADNIAVRPALRIKLQ